MQAMDSQYSSNIESGTILDDPGVASRDLIVNFHQEHSIIPTSSPWLTEDSLVLNK